MATQNFRLHDSKGGSALTVRITPRASRNEIAGVSDDGTIRVRLTSPAAEDQSNPALINFLSQILEVSPESIEIVAGRAGKDKLISILDLDAETLHKKILAQL